MNTRIDTQSTVGALAAQYPQLIPVLEHLGLDYCCHGNRTLTDACAHRHLDPESVRSALDAALGVATAGDERSWIDASMTELADHIEQVHHAYSRSAFARLTAMAEKVATKHAERHPELVELRALVHALSDDMHDHMVREERVLFPWLRRLESPSEIQSGPPWSVRRPISCMEHDHEDVKSAFDQIRQLTGGLTPPDDACGTYRALFALLKELERDTHLHIHKENNILFPAGIRAEQSRQDPEADPVVRTMDRTKRRASEAR